MDMLVQKIALPSDQDATGRNLGDEEIAAVSEAIRSGTLTSTKGRFVKALEERFAAKLGVKHAFACASGSAAVHCAVAAIDPSPGDEIITTGITDMGALAPIVYQGAIPVFADVDPKTCNVTAEAVAARLSERTKAIIVTHLFGNPCEMDAITALARERNIPVIEDCAQAFGSTYDGRPVGTLGAIGTFSLQQGKHITTGEGGLVVTNDDALARRIFLFINKAWGYGDPQPDHYFLALNYRMSELCGAVAVAQLEKLDAVVERRIELAADLTERLSGLPGVSAPFVGPKSRHTYWKYCIRVDDHIVPEGVGGIARLLRAYEIFTAPRYIQKPAFMCQVFRDQRTFGDSRFPFTLAREEAVDYRRELFPGTFEALDGILVIPWNDRFTEQHVRYIADAIRASVAKLQGDA
ncbi:MAG TPA: DegT/DnrJ/EryC1/StrS family aminotransferase [Candidatus Dormibacteraeota bacterium]|nr:DegT/DnrJ/EryC1/StrS family aminotransferase [Candidatus Dormibacteraeota bacterium]